MNPEKTKNNVFATLMQKLDKVPLVALMVVLCVVGAFSRLYQVTMIANSMSSLSSFISTTSLTVFVAVLTGILFPFIIRLFARIEYAIGSRLYFRLMAFVPDTNLRRLPIQYNSFLKVVLAINIIDSFVLAFFNLLLFKYPFTIYLVSMIDFVIKAVLYVISALMLKTFVDDWQCKNTFLALAIPTGILFCIGIII